MACNTGMRWAVVLLTRVLAVSAAVTAQMPYNPTRILQSNDTLYVFRPSSKSPTQFQLSAIDLSSAIQSSNLPYNTLYSTLPFLDDNAPRAFTPLLDTSGNLTIYAGDCRRGASGAEIWTYTPEKLGGGERGSWSQANVTAAENSNASIMGANFLNDGMSFSSVVGGNAENTGVYLFGGMCPNATATMSDCQSAANYSNQVLTLNPSPIDGQALSYHLDTSSSRGPPVPEAGFTITGLPPTFSQRTDGAQIQQQNFVLIGGHTSAAFINTSQIALFSLPEQSWTFVSAEQPDTSTTNSAMRKDVSTIDPRSGHTAVLSPDGQGIIVLGGWVGDINTPAEPQLAVLNVADGYGGSGDWQWTVPSITGSGLPANSGLYGHAATMLPGGVLMVTGGYSIPSGARQRRDSSTVNTQTYFLNTTSHTWIADYSPPAKPTTPVPADKGLLSTTGQKAGLGVGIGIGLAVVCGLVAFCIWYRRRAQKRRDLREKQLQDLSYTAHRYNPEDYAPAFDDRTGQLDISDHLIDQNGPYVFPSGTHGGQGWKATTGGDAERTGLLVEIPSPTRGLRRSLSGRPGYAVGRPQVPIGIHPIDELEEEPDDDPAHNTSPLSSRHPEMAELRSKLMASMLSNSEVSGSPVDAPRHDHGSYMQEGPGHNRTHSFGRLQLNSAGRLSPEKFGSERTSSNLSERSAMSWASSHDGAAGGVSMRPGNISGSSRSPDASLSSNRNSRGGEVGRHSPDEPRTNSMNSVQSNGQPDLESFKTAQSSFAQLQAEGEALLGGNPDRPRPGTGSSKSDAYRDTDASNSRAATATPATSCALDMSNAPQPSSKVRRISWLGSVRRVLTRSVSSAERTRSMVTPTTYYEPYRDDPISPIEPRPADNTKSFPAATAPPQRAASDASFWRNRRGKKDWLDEEDDSAWRRAPGDDWGTPEDIALAERERQRQEWRERGNLLVNINNDDRLPTPRSPIAPGHLGVPAADGRPCTPASEADWDVEAAVERRVVQVMFTVPKSKLRVVNADIEGSSITSMPQDGDDRTMDSASSGNPTSRVKDLAGRFEQMNGSTSSLKISPRPSPRPSPSNSIKSMKVRQKRSGASLARQQSVRNAAKERGLKPVNRGEADAEEE